MFLGIGAYVPRGFPLYADRRSGQAGTGGARSWAIRARIGPKIRRDTATSAIWNVKSRPWLTILAPILTNFFRSVVNDQCSSFCDYVTVSFGSPPDHQAVHLASRLSVFSARL